MACYSPLRGYQGPDGKLVFKKSQSVIGQSMTVGCGYCIGCRSDKAQVWAARIVHEAESWDRNCFLTLTYDPEHLPFPPSLDKEHVPKFIRKLRKQFPGKTIRYFYCGEYGDKLERPHYHVCLFNFEPDDREFFSEREGIVTYTSRYVEEMWAKGFCTVGELNYETAAYTARYILKKVTGTPAHDHYCYSDLLGNCHHLEPEFINMSRRPGIGKEWYDNFKSDVFPSDENPVPGKGVFKKAPRYYEKLLERDDPECLEDVKRTRREHMAKHKEDYTVDRLYARYRVHKAKFNKLHRGYES